METERSNLLSFARSTVRDVVQRATAGQAIVIDKPVTLGRSCEALTASVHRLLLVIEHCLCHGLRRDMVPTDPSSTEQGTDFWSNVKRAKDHVLSKATTLLLPSARPDPWPLLLHLEQCFPNHLRLTETTTTFSDVHTGLGRSRIWIRQALMQKCLGTYIQHLVDDVCHGSVSNTPNGDVGDADQERRGHRLFYTPGAMLMNDEGIVFAGILVGIASLDFSFVIKENLGEFDSELPAIPYHLYMDSAIGEQGEASDTQRSDQKSDLESLIEQKKFLEDLSSKLEHRLELAQVSQRAQEERMKALNTNLEELSLENRGLRISLIELRKNRSSVGTEREVKSPTADPTVKSPPISPSPSPSDQMSNSLELESLRLQNGDLSSQLTSLQQELNESRSNATKLNRQLLTTQTLVNQKQQLISQLEGKVKGLNRIVEQMRERISSLDTDKLSAERCVSQLRLQLTEVQSRLTIQTSKLEEQTDKTAQLERALNDRNAELAAVKPKLKELEKCQTQMTTMEKELVQLRTLCREQETSLSEMAAVVSSSKLEADILRESHDALKDAQWTDDSMVTNCSRCKAAFTVSRRRHHCRNCGLIFCHNCSSRSLPLPSSAKPVRVCDGCHALLLHRYVAKST